MKNAFSAYYPPSESELKELWEGGLIILDANALLVFFRYSASTREEFLRVLTGKQESLWLPHQVGLEFHRNRLKVVAEQKQAFERTTKFLSDLNAQAHESISKLNIRRHIALDVDDLEKRLRKRIDKVSADVRRLQRAHHASLRDGEDERILCQIAELYEGRVGSPYSAEQLEAIYGDGRDRYAREQPPGYKDSKEKGEPGMFGDLVLWRQILDKGAQSRQPALFVTDDLKEDWWLFVSGERKGPRPELVEEYQNSSGSRIQFYTPQSFLHLASARGTTVSSETQEEVKEVSRAHASFLDRPIDDGRLQWHGERHGTPSALPSQSKWVSQRVATLEERQVELRHHRNLIEHRIAMVDESEVLRDKVVPGLLEQRAIVDDELMRVTGELDALRRESIGHDRSFERGRHSHLGAAPWADYVARENERQGDTRWHSAARDDNGPTAGVAGLPSAG